MSEIIIIGGTSGIGRALAQWCAADGHDVVIAGRNAARAADAAEQLQQALPAHAGRVRGIAADLAQPHGLRSALGASPRVSHLVLAGIERDSNRLDNYQIDAAIKLATIKLVGYAAAVAAVQDRFDAGGSVLLFGGVAKDRPYPGSTTMSSVNAGIDGMVTTLSHELKPVRVNAIHPGPVGDSPAWSGNAQMLALARTRVLTGVLPTMRDIVDGCLFLMHNPAANGVSLDLDGGKA